MDTYKRSIRGLQSRANGEHFEGMIIAASRFYEDEEDDEPEWTEEDEAQYAETFKPYPGFENFKLGGNR